MFYIKITDENVFTKCPECGEEICVDLFDVFDNGDLYSTSIICPACTKKRSSEITLGGIKLLVDFMNKSNCAELVHEIYLDFGIEELEELTPDQYKDFSDALFDIAQ